MKKLLLFLLLAFAFLTIRADPAAESALLMQVPHVSGSVTPPTPDLLWLKFNNNFTDSSVSGNNGSGVNSPSFNTGQDGIALHALVCSGASQAVTVPNSASLKPATLSLMSWVNLSALTSSVHGGGASSAEMYFMSMDDDQGGGGASLYGFYYNSGTVYGICGSVFQAMGTISSISVWHHIAVTYDGSAVVTYFDGAQTSSTPFSGSISYGTLNGFTVGCRSRGSDQNAYNAFTAGSFDDTRLYTGAITSAQVAAIYGTQAAAREEKFRLAMENLINRLYVKFT